MTTSLAATPSLKVIVVYLSMFANTLKITTCQVGTECVRFAFGFIFGGLHAVEREREEVRGESLGERGGSVRGRELCLGGSVVSSYPRPVFPTYSLKLTHLPVGDNCYFTPKFSTKIYHVFVSTFFHILLSTLFHIY